MIIAHRGPAGEMLSHASVVVDEPGSVALGSAVRPMREAPALWTPGYGATAESHWEERVGADAAEQAEPHGFVSTVVDDYGVRRGGYSLSSLTHGELLAKIDRDLVALADAHEQADADDALEIDLFADARARADDELAEIDELAEAEAREIDAMHAWYDERDALADAQRVYASVLAER